MKKHFSWIFIAIIAISSCQENYKDYIPFNIEDIKSMEDVNIYVSKETIKPSTEIEGFGRSITSPNFESWFVFIDLHPFANWMHPCQYIFIDAKTGKRTVIDENFPPDYREQMEILKEVTYDMNGELLNFDNIETRTVTNSDNLWAVIISGGGNRFNNHVRYWNDCAAMYTILTRQYGYRRDHIFVIMADGTNPAADRLLLNGTFDSSPLDLDGDGLADIQFAASRANLTNVFNQLSNRLTTSDELFIFTMDHGGRSGYNSTLVLWNNEEIYDNEFANLINPINAKSINIVMGQCYSGGFINHLNKNNRVIATACDVNQLSWARSNLLYDEFVYHWMSAANKAKIDTGTTVSADINYDGNLSAWECYNYAVSNDESRETPRFDPYSQGLSHKLTLGGMIQLPTLPTNSISIGNVTRDFGGNIVEMMFTSSHTTTSNIEVSFSLRGDCWTLDGRQWEPRYELVEYEMHHNVMLRAGENTWYIKFYAPDNGIFRFIDYQGGFIQFPDNNYQYVPGNLTGRALYD